MISSVKDFIKYYEGVRRRTLRDIGVIPPEYIDWAPRPGEMTLGDIIRHIGSTARFYVTKIVQDRWAYPGHKHTGESGLGGAIAHLNRMHAEAMAELANFPDAELQSPRQSMEDYSVQAWRFLMVMIEHEVHHRSQIDCNLSTLGVSPPQIFGWRIEDIVEKIKREKRSSSMDTQRDAK